MECYFIVYKKLTKDKNIECNWKEIGRSKNESEASTIMLDDENKELEFDGICKYIYNIKHLTTVD